MKLTPKNMLSFETRLKRYGIIIICLPLLFFWFGKKVSHWDTSLFISISIIMAFLLFAFLYHIYIQIMTILNVTVNCIEGLRNKSFNITPSWQYQRGVLQALTLELKTLTHQLQQFNFQYQQEEFLLFKLIEQLNTPLLFFNDKNQLIRANVAANEFLKNDWQFVKGEQLTSFGLNLKNGNIIYQAQDSAKWKVKSSLLTESSHCFRVVLLQNIDKELRDKEMDAWHKIIRVIGHEIRNSLVPIYSMSQILSQQFDDKHQHHKAIQMISSRCKKLNEFVNRTIKLVEIPQPYKQNILFSSIITESQTLFANIDYIFDLKVDEIYADPIQIEQVVINLLKNASEAMKEHRQITISSQLTPHGVEISITDQGEGVSDIDNIFLPFYSTKATGSGIGLPLCKQIIQNHGGNIVITNGPDEKGTRVIFSLPYAEMEVESESSCRN